MSKDPTSTGAGYEDPLKNSAGAIFGLFVLEWVILIPLSENNETVKDLIPSYWWTTLILPAAFGLATWFVPTLGKFWRTATTATLVAIIFLSFGLLSLAVMAVVFAPPHVQMPVLRFLFIIVASLLPGVLCYLFVTTKRHSLLNEYLINVDKLGLLPSNFATLEEEEASLILEVYFRKFESVYGPLDEINRKQAIVEMIGRVGTALALQTAHRLKTPAAPATGTQGTGSGGLPNAIDELGVRVLPANLGYPLVLATVLISLGWLVSLPLTHVPDGDGKDWSEAFIPEATPVNFAFLGAYFFSMQMLFRRYVVRDLSGSAYTAVAIRILLAVIGTWAVLAAWAALPSMFGDLAPIKPFDRVPSATPPPISYGGLVLGFVIGVFPEIAWQIISEFVSRAFKFALRRVDSEMPLRFLDGLTVWHESRLAEEDIENIPNMATIEIAQLMLHTPFPPERIIDWVDQAILYTHLGDAKEFREVLRKHGIRTATGLLAAHEGSITRNDQDAFEKLLGKAGEDGGRSCIRSLLDALQTDANLKLVRNWINHA